MINSKIKRTFVFIILGMIIFFNSSKIQAQISGQLYLTGPTTVHYGDVVSYSLKDAMDNNTPSSALYNNFNWMINDDGSVLTFVNESYQPNAEVYWDGVPNQEKVYVLYQRQGESNQYYAELNVTVLPTPSIPDSPTILSSGCNQVVLQRGNPVGNIRTGGQDITWYWQSTPTGTSTANSASTITLTSGTVYYLRARRSNGIWSDGASSIQFLIGIPAPIITNVSQPTITTPTGSVSLAGLPSTGTWVINPGNISGSGETKIVTGLSPSTTYNFTVKNSSGCISSASANVIINAQSSTLDAPVLSSVKQPDCNTSKGEFTITNYNASYTYTAIPSTGVSFLGAKVLAPQGNYTIKAVSGVTTSQASANVMVYAQPITPSAPIVGTITHPTLTTATGSVQLSGLPSVGWTINPGNISGVNTITTITGLKAGLVYNLTVTNSSGCTSAASANIVINLQPFACSGISDENYVHTIVPQIATTDIGSLTASQKKESITYYDGIGRPKQKITIRGGGVNSKDIISFIGYDNFGRQTKEYLPYTDGNDCGAFRTADIDMAVKAYYKIHYPTDINATIPNPYSEKEIESSPLSRVLKQAAPGYDWRLGAGHEIKMVYQTNKDEDLVKLYTVEFVLTNNIYTPKLRNNGFYSNYSLYKNSSYDENTAASPLEKDGSTIEFKNKEGQVVLKRTYGTVESGAVNEKHDTYYVYDDFGNLTYVIPPKAADLIGATSTQADLTSTAQLTSASPALNLVASNSIRLLPGFQALAGSNFTAVIDGNKTVLDNLCYQYKYDYRNRLVEKKLPGKQWEFIVYDKLDRVVATGPANSPFTDITTSGWSITKYDVFNRPVITGWLPATVTDATRKTLQDDQNALTANFNETKIVTATNTIIPATTGVKFRYDNAAWPTSGYHILSVNYYDDYNFPDAPSSIPATVAANTTGLSQAVYYNATIKPIGLATGSWVRVPDLSTSYKYEQDYILYDAKARPVRSYTQNFLGGFTCVDNKLEAFSGQLQYTITTHSRLSTDPILKTTETFTYSAQDRLISQTHQIGTGTVETLFTNTYDELGQLVSKKVGGNTQKVDYSYNIRGWLTGINDVDALSKTGDAKDLFAFRINYNTANTAGVKALYNGNIAETYWSTGSEATPVVRGYGYVYDNLNRLRTGIFKQGTTVNNYYDETLTYDKNGNIMSLNRNGYPTAVQQIDKLAYSYGTGNSTNQLTKVVDNATTYKAGGFVDSAANTTDDYSYDANGNMTKDNNKNITSITYNHLNLPVTITFATTGNIVYLYNATGQKVRKVINETGKPQIITDYLGGYQYDNSLLKFFPTAEGYVEVSGSSYKYIYQYKDHLGNIRLSYDKILAIKEESNFYPFGLKQEGYNTVKIGFENKYKYNGKELQDDSIGGWKLNLYDYGARNYDPALGRWMNIDPLAEKSRRFSPYTYALNNPVYFIDPDGMQAMSPIYDPQGKFLGTDENGLRGMAVVMKKEDFTQGMSSKEAESKNLGDGAFESDKAFSKAANHFEGLKKRPDYDGKLTLKEANEWFRKGGGEPLFVDAAKINLEPIETGDFDSVGSSMYNNFFLSTNQETGAVYGTIKLTLDDENGSVTLGGKNGYLDRYNFDQKKPDGSIKTDLRNIGTKAGEILAGKGTAYKIYNYGKGKVEKTKS